MAGACFIAWVGTTDLYMCRSANTEMIFSSLQSYMRCWSPNVSSRTIPHHGSDINRTNSKSNYAALMGYSHDLVLQRHRDQVNPSLGLGDMMTDQACEQGLRYRSDGGDGHALSQTIAVLAVSSPLFSQP